MQVGRIKVMATRTFNGDKYKSIDWATNRIAADKRADNVRRKGYYARVVKLKGGYVIYQSIMKRKRRR